MPWEHLSVPVPKSGLPCCDSNDSQNTYVLNKVIPEAYVITQTLNSHAMVITSTSPKHCRTAMVATVATSCMKTRWHKLNSEQIQPLFLFFFFLAITHGCYFHFKHSGTSEAVDVCIVSGVLLQGRAQSDASCVTMVEVLSLTFVHDVPDLRSYSLEHAFSARLLHSGSGLLNDAYLREP